MNVVKSYINEKFTEDSDPIDDLGIGMMHQIKKWYCNKFNAQLFDKRHALLFSASDGKVDFLEFLLLKNNIKDINYSDSILLRIAAYQEKKEIVKYLLKSGADINKAIINADKHNEYHTKRNLLKIKDNINSYLNEKFTEDSDPIADMNIGLKHQILNDLKKIEVSENDIEFFDDYTFFSKRYDKKYEDNFIKIQLKYFPEKKKQLVKKLLDPSKDIIEIINESIKDKIKKDEIMYIIKYFLEGSSWKSLRGNDISRDLKRARFYMEKLKRTPEKKREEKENNVYVFVGYLDKSPVVVNGKKYFEEKLKAEKMVKIKDKYDINEMTQISMMKLRARVQYGGQTGSGVFMITVPKFMMDEDYYNDIPEEYYDIIEKHKVEI